MRKTRLLISLLCTVLLLSLLSGCFLRREKKRETAAYMHPAEQYVIALQNNDYAVLKSAVPLAVLLNSGLGSEELDARSRNMRAKYGDDLKITIAETDSYPLSDELLKEFTDYLREEYQFNANITEAYLISGYLTLSGSLKKENSAGYFVSYCIAGTWYLDVDAYNALADLRTLIQK